MRYLGCVIVFFIIIVIAFSGCKNTKSDVVEECDSIKNDTTIIDSDSVAQIVSEPAIPQKADENFNDFIYSFTHSHKYQLERVVFPLPLINNNDTDFINKKDWQFTRLHLENEVYTVFFDTKKSMEIEKYNDLQDVKIEMFDMNKNKVCDYCFNKLKSEWHLVKIKKYPLTNYPDHEFMIFYNKFASDSLFRNENMNSMISYVGPNPEDDYETISGTISSAQWSAFCPDLPALHFTNIDYGQAKTDGNMRVVVLESGNSGFYSVLFFKKAQDSWKLYRYEN